MRLFFILAVIAPALSLGCLSDKDCSNHGKCTSNSVDDITHGNDSDNFCNCDKDYYGVNCADYCPISCVNGECKQNGSKWQCICKENWEGDNCARSVLTCPDKTKCYDGQKCVKSDRDDESDQEGDSYDCETVKCPAVPSNGCSVCGPGSCITNEDAIFRYPGQPSVKCDMLQEAGMAGMIPNDECGFLPGLVNDVCVCHSNSPVAPSPIKSPTTPPNGLDPNSIGCQSNADCSNHGTCKPGIDSGDISHSNSPTNYCECDEDYSGASCSSYCPISCVNGSCRAKNGGDFTCSCRKGYSGSSCERETEECPDGSRCFDGKRCVKNDDDDESDPEDDTYTCENVVCSRVPDGGCSICGEGKCVTNEKAIFSFPAQPSVPCGKLQEGGYDGQVPLDQCVFLPSLVKDICGCHKSTSDILPPVNTSNGPPSRSPIGPGPGSSYFTPSSIPVQPPTPSPNRRPTRPPRDNNSYLPPTKVDREPKTRAPNNYSGMYVEEPGLSNGAIAGIVIGSCIGLFLLILGGAKMCRSSKRTYAKGSSTSAGVIDADGSTTMQGIDKIGVEAPLPK